MEVGKMGETRNEMNETGICDALEELKFLQDYLKNFKTKYFGYLFSKIAGVDTIPFILFTKDGALKLEGVYQHDSSNKEEHFVTSLFRIEEIDRETCCATISLLVPLDIHGIVTESFCDLMMLKKTTICITINLKDSCGIQLLETELLKREIIIEPKW
jgi:hypothetical protein